MNEVFELRGYVCASENRSGFVVPLFRTDGSNRLFGQIMDAVGLVVGFEPLDPASFIAVDAGQHLALSVGEPAVWAYRLPGEIPIIGRRSMVAEKLRHLLQRITDPLLRLQAAEFCDAPTARTEAWRGSFDMLARTAPASAEAWRDLVVLPRQVRNAVATALAAPGGISAKTHRTTALDRDLGSAVSVDVHRGAMRVTLDAPLFDLLQSQPSALAEIEADVTEVRKAFGLRFDAIARGAPGGSAPPDRRSRIVRPIVAAGDHAVAVLDALLRTPERRVRPSGRGGHGPAHLRKGEQPLIIADDEAVLHRKQAFSEEIVHLLSDAPEQGASVLPFVFAVSANQAALVDWLASLADGARLRGWIPVAVVPHLPDPALMRDPDLYRSLLERIDGAFLRTWLISEQSAHGRSGLPFGPSRSVDAAAGRLAGLLASLPPSTEFQGKKVDEDGGIEVGVLSSAVAGMDLSPPRLLDRALGRAADAALRIVPVTEADAELPVATASLRMDDAEGLLSRMVPGGSQVTWTHPPRQTSAHSSLRLSRVRWVPMALSDFDDACMAELDRHGWRIDRTEVALAAITATKDETRVPIAFKATGGSTASRPLGSRTLRRNADDVLLLTDATIHRGDFARQLVDGRMPLHFGRIASLTTIWRQRHLHLIRALRGTAALQDRTVARAAFDLLKAMQRSDRLDGTLSNLIADGADLDEERSFVARLPDALRVDVAIVARDGSARAASRDVGLVLTAAGWSVDDRGG